MPLSLDMYRLIRNKQVKERYPINMDTNLIEKENQFINFDKIGVFNEYYSTDLNLIERI